ncbi:hypothetical protein LO772_27335 [Yinghuangia sp. ASG 101]|uniref:hypothetical protein n=1 Tax=Yinghuangia sp. ASG 101 TaxID=2896848 RepID=UPI001E482AD5|nr:hypothetical protein [Yinghuangia sp. ASG 101]UGQ10528.1 hypothetical protein LO772_27335 [Yinghuangia sp. ASG 101]
MHIHVGYNMPGYLPDTEPMCFVDLDSAMDAFRHELKDRQGDYWEACLATATEDPEGGTCECAWCGVAGDAEAAISAIADGDAAYALKKASGAEPREWSVTLSPPEGPDVSVWAVILADDVEQCMLAEIGAY